MGNSVQTICNYIIGNAKNTSSNVTIFNNPQIEKLIMDQRKQEEESVKNKTLNWSPTGNCFAGREDILQIIKEGFTDKKYVVLHGMPGIGKTETARQFGNRNCDFFNGNLIWIFSETSTNIKKCFKKLAKSLKLEINDASLIFNQFKTSKALFVFDNAENMAAIRNYLPSNQLHPNVYVLITSQFGEWDLDIFKVQLYPLNRNDAMDIFKAKLKENFQKYSVKTWEKLVDELERIPLSLQIVSSIIKQKIRLPSFNLDEYIPNVMKTFINTTISKSEQNYYNKSVLAAIYTALSRLEEEEEEDNKDLYCLDVLCAIAYFDADRIFISDLFEVPSIKNLESSLNKLEDYSLIQLLEDPYFSRMKIKVHRTTQFVLRDYELKKRNGGIFTTLLRISVSGKISWHETSIFKYANKELLEITKEFYNKNLENESLVEKYVRRLVCYNCDKALQIILLKFMNDRTERFIRMLLYAIYLDRDFKTIQVFFKIVAQNEENVRQIEALHEWRSIKFIDILFESNIFKNKENFSEDNIILKNSVLGRFLHSLVRKSYKKNVKETIECINYLLSKWDVSVLYQDDSFNILHTACENEEISVEIIEYLFQLENGKLKEIVDCQNKKKETSLHNLLFMNINNPDLDKIFRYFIIECQADIKIQDEEGRNIFFYICHYGSFEMIEFILSERDCSQIINDQDESGDVAFSKIILNFSIKEADIVKLFNVFLKYKMDINLKNKYNKTLLEISEEEGLNTLAKVIKNNLKELKNREKTKG